MFTSLYAMSMLFKTTSPQKLFDYECITLYHILSRPTPLHCTRQKIIYREYDGLGDPLRWIISFHLSLSPARAINQSEGKLNLINQALFYFFYYSHLRYYSLFRFFTSSFFFLFCFLLWWPLLHAPELKYDSWLSNYEISS